MDGINDCVRKAWFVNRDAGDFTNAIGTTIGQNFTSDLYLASVGPHDGDGIVVGNFSAIGLNWPLGPGIRGPAVKDMPLADNTLTRLAVLNETVLSFNLDKNSTINTTFYMLAIDSNFDSQSALTSVMTDDDFQFAQWTFSNSPIDFNSSELFTGINANWTAEQWGSLPTDAWQGNARFGNDYPNKTWEEQPGWNIPFFNNTHMILQKDAWKVDSSTNISTYLTVYNFDKTKVQNANVTVKKISRALPFLGFQPLPVSNYTVDTTYDKTDANGAAFLKISPNPTANQRWSDGQYQVLLNVQGPGGNETFERWFCVGAC